MFCVYRGSSSVSTVGEGKLSDPSRTLVISFLLGLGPLVDRWQTVMILSGTIRGLLLTLVGASRAIRVAADAVAELLVALAFLFPLQVRVSRLLVTDAPKESMILLCDSAELLTPANLVQGGKHGGWVAVVQAASLHDSCHALDQGTVVSLNLSTTILLLLGLLQLLVQMRVHLRRTIVDRRLDGR